MSQSATADSAEATPSSSDATRSPGRWRYLVAGATLLVLGSASSWAAHTFLGTNFSVVVAGSCYRSAQPSPEQLRRWVREHGIRWVVNLRGSDGDEDWFDAEEEVARECSTLERR